MRSMTGFGIGEHPMDKGKLIIEIRGVNHRFLDVRCRVPREVADLATFVEQLGRERLNRGRYEVSLRIEGVSLGAPTLDRERARSAYKALCDLRDELAPGADVPLQLLAGIPDLFICSVDQEMDELQASSRAAFEKALVALDEMRDREGQVLHEDMTKRLDTVRRLAQAVEQRAPLVLEIHRKRLKERAERLRIASEIEVDGTRLEQEIATFAERVDICEELTRLESHCAQFAGLVASTEACGRRLDFLLQEMAREVNTVGAKSPDAQITHAVVEVKAELERMREQVQNIE